MLRVRKNKKQAARGRRESNMQCGYVALRSLTAASQCVGCQLASGMTQAGGALPSSCPIPRRVRLAQPASEQPKQMLDNVCCYGSCKATYLATLRVHQAGEVVHCPRNVVRG